MFALAGMTLFRAGAYAQQLHLANSDPSEYPFHDIILDNTELPPADVIQQMGWGLDMYVVLVFGVSVAMFPKFRAHLPSFLLLWSGIVALKYVLQLVTQYQVSPKRENLLPEERELGRSVHNLLCGTAFDMMLSGHTATIVLLALFAWKLKLGAFANVQLVAMPFVLFGLVYARQHYTADVILGAAVALLVFKCFEQRPTTSS
jgi:hypothetical protein